MLSIGLIGLAALLPVGRLAILETAKSDRAGNCGRSGLHAVKACRMLDCRNWTNNTADSTANQNGGTFVIDPLGVGYGNPINLPGGPVAAVNLNGLSGNQAATERLFRWQDDLSFNSSGPGVRPVGVPDAITGQIACVGDYSWFFTVTPAASETALRNAEANANPPVPPAFRSPYHYTVSVVVCYKRDLTSGTGQVTATATPLGNNGWTGNIAGGDVTLSSFSSGVPFNVKEYDWIALCGQVTGNIYVCRWYRVVAVGDTVPGSSTQYLSLNGPDCPDWMGQVTAITLNKEIIGVYTEPVEIDREPAW